MTFHHIQNRLYYGLAVAMVINIMHGKIMLLVLYKGNWTVFPKLVFKSYLKQNHRMEKCKNDITLTKTCPEIQQMACKGTAIYQNLHSCFQVNLLTPFYNDFTMALFYCTMIYIMLGLPACWLGVILEFLQWVFLWCNQFNSVIIRFNP